MPIAGISEIVRMPRLGKIRLGMKVPRGEILIPKALDYFNCPPEVQQVFGEKPKELEIMFPTEELGQFAQQWLRCYSMTQGLICIGNGETCRRKGDMDTGDLASHTTREGRWEWHDGLPCNPQECEEYLGKRCRRVMNLQFLLPQVPGLGVWQIDTTSFYSIVNINSMVRMLQAMLGRCSMIPLTLALGPIEVTPLGQKKKTVHIMHIKKDVKLADLAKLALLPPARVLIPEPEVEEAPEDLYPPEVLSQEASPPLGDAWAAAALSKPQPYPSTVGLPISPQPTTGDVCDTGPTTAQPPLQVSPARSLKIENVGQLFEASWRRYKMDRAAVLAELNVYEAKQIKDPQAAWALIVSVREGPPGAACKGHSDEEG